jgi:putative PIN family toxin of toxin-antitoxin system
MLRGLVSRTSPAAQIIAFADARKFVTLLSRPVLLEYRDVLLDRGLIGQFPLLTRRRVEKVIERIAFSGDYIRNVRRTFKYDRDPLDAKFIELAIAGRATHLVTYDGDLLDLPHGSDDAAKRFRQLLPRLKVLEAGAFLQHWESSRSDV